MACRTGGSHRTVRALDADRAPTALVQLELCNDTSEGWSGQPAGAVPTIKSQIQYVVIPHPDDVAVVSKRLGHSSPVITWQTYQHVRKGMQTDAAERVADAIFGPVS